MSEEEPQSRRTDLGMLTLGKLAMIVSLSLSVMTGITSAIVSQQITNLELRLTQKFPERERVVDIATYRAEKHELDSRIAKLEADTTVYREEITRLRLELDRKGAR